MLTKKHVLYVWVIWLGIERHKVDIGRFGTKSYTAYLSWIARAGDKYETNDVRQVSGSLELGMAPVIIELPLNDKSW